MTGTPIEAVSGDAVIAIRPDDLTPGPDAPISAVVETAEYRGRDFYGTARTSDNLELFFRSERKVASGETVRLGADPARVLVYARSAA
jgi:putative spermidine/putrescine transport system ATP-binding protein